MTGKHKEFKMMMEVDDHGKLAEWDGDPGDPFFMVCEYYGKEQNMLDEINSERGAVSALYFCYECSVVMTNQHR